MNEVIKMLVHKLLISYKYMHMCAGRTVINKQHCIHYVARPVHIPFTSL